MARRLRKGRYELAGRPDYVVRSARGLVPVEVKSRACGSRGPYAGERAQLLAYCLLTEDALSGTVTSGVLEYRDRRISVPFGERERQEITGDGNQSCQKLIHRQASVYLSACSS